MELNFECNSCKKIFSEEVSIAISNQITLNKPKNDQDQHVFVFVCEECSLTNEKKLVK